MKPISRQVRAEFGNQLRVDISFEHVEVAFLIHGDIFTTLNEPERAHDLPVHDADPRHCLDISLVIALNVPVWIDWRPISVILLVWLLMQHPPFFVGPGLQFNTILKLQASKRDQNDAEITQ